MFESSFSMAVTKWANENRLDSQYYQCWQPLKKNFNPDWKPTGGLRHRNSYNVSHAYFIIIY